MPSPKGAGLFLAGFVKELIEGLSTKATPELAERMARPHGQFEGALRTPVPEGQVQPGVALRGADSPIADEAMRGAARTTAAKVPMTTAEVARKGKNVLLAAVERAPELPKDLRQREIDMAVGQSVAKASAELSIKHRMLDHLTGDRPARLNKVQLMSDYIVALDEVAQLTSRARRDGAAPESVVGLGSKTLAEWNDFLSATGEQLKKTPDVIKAVKEYRAMADETFDDMVERGLIIPERRREDYFTNQKIGLIQDALEQLRGSESQTKIGSVIPALFKREGGVGARETNVVTAFAEQLEHYYRNVAEGEFAGHVLADPSLNKTKAAAQTGIIPPGYTVWTPKQGQAGFGVMAPESQIINGLMRGLAADGKRYQGGYVIPKEIAHRLDNIRVQNPDQLSDVLYKSGQFFARQMTVYNPANWALNMMSDLPVAMLGLPGEKARPMGVLRFALMDEDGQVLPAIRAAWAATKGKDFNVKAGGQTINAADLAQTQGLTTAGEAQAFGGMPVSHNLDSAAEAGGSGVLNQIRSVKNAIEAYPRIAAGLEAFSRTGSLEEFGRVGRHSTLNYGHGAPDWSRVPAFRFLAPFTQFMGLATERVASLVKTPGSRGRALTALASVPVAFHMWNNQNDAFKAVEQGVQGYDKGNLHFIVPDPDDPSQPYRDRTGKPVIIRARWWVPEEVMSFFGLGNLATRGARVLSGEDTIAQAAADVPKTAARNVVAQIGPVRSLIEAGSGRNITTGQEQTTGKALRKVHPLTNQLLEAVDEYRDTGKASDAGRVLAEQVGGVRFINPSRRGARVRDADRVEWGRRLTEARKRLRAANVNKDRVAAEEARAMIKEATTNLRRLAEAKRKERSSR